MFFLHEAQQQVLINEPETGMGYQLVQVTTEARRRVAGLAYNAAIVFELHEPRQRSTFQAIARGAAVAAAGEPVRSVRLLPPGSAAYRAFLVGEGRAPYATRGIAARDAAIVTTHPGEVFRRFSAFARDCRIHPDGGLVSGSFATTAEDARSVRRGNDVLPQYALPQPGPLDYVFEIRPATMTLVHYGTAQAAFDQPGGGVEVIFTEGTTPHTVTGPVGISMR